MASAEYFTAESEDGGVVFDPSEDALYLRVSDLRLPSNGFLTIEPPNPKLGWYVVISLLDEGGYEVEYRDPRRSVHDVAKESDPSNLCRDVMIWLRGAVAAGR